MYARTRESPWRNDIDIRSEAIERELKADLVVALARASMWDVASKVEWVSGKNTTRKRALAALAISYLNHSPSNDWSSERRAEKIDILAE